MGDLALVTAGVSAIGRDLTLALAGAGHAVAFTHLGQAAAAVALVEQIAAAGGRALAVESDTGDEAQVLEFHLRAAEWAGCAPKILVNNAGVQTWKALLELTEEEWDHVLDTNLKGCFLCTQQAARMMKEAGGGRIINIGSGCNKLAFPRLVNYTASKGGIEQLTKVAAVELGKYGIRVNCVAPGAVEIERTKEEAGDYAGTWAGVTPLGRVGTPMDVGRAVVFFAGELSDFVTGQTLYVDGGLFAKPHWPYEY